jgi:hypothetical protein
LLDESCIVHTRDGKLQGLAAREEFMEALEEVRELAKDVCDAGDELVTREELHIVHVNAADEVIVSVAAADPDPDPFKVLQLSRENILAIILVI